MRKIDTTDKQPEPVLETRGDPLAAAHLHRTWRTNRAAPRPSKSSMDPDDVTACSYIGHMISTGIRELKNKLSHYVRQVEAGERIAVTAHGRVVAELVPPATETRAWRSWYDELIAAGIIEPAAKPDALPPEWPDIRVSPGTAAQLIDSDRGEP